MTHKKPGAKKETGVKYLWWDFQPKTIISIRSFPGKIFFQQWLISMPNHVFHECTHSN